MQPFVREGRERAERRRDVRRLGVVHEPHATDLPDELDAMRDTLEARKRIGDRLVVDPHRTRGSGRGGGVLTVVRPGDARLGRERIVGRELDARPVPGYGAEPARHDRGVRGRLSLEDPELELRVVLERAVPVEVVGLEVEENGNARLQRVNVLQLERRELADDPRVRRRGADERRERAADVSGHLDIPAAQRGRRRRGAPSWSSCRSSR